MTVRDMLAALQTLPRDAELLAFEAACEDYCEREVDEVNGRAAGDQRPPAGSRPGCRTTGSGPPPARPVAAPAGPVDARGWRGPPGRYRLPRRPYPGPARSGR